MSHIDAAMMRIVISTDVFPLSLIVDSESSLYANLAGCYEPEIYPQQPRAFLGSLYASTIVAHEQRHYLDYLLTNYGSWMSLFWSQLSQFVAALAETSEPFVVPLKFFGDTHILRALGIEMPSEGPVRHAAVLAYNHGFFVEKDHVQEGRFSGSVQLEAVATAFEVGPIERLVSPDYQLPASLALPRNLAKWQARYAWPADVLYQFGVTDPPISMKGLGHVVYTRLWPAFFIASLMGEFNRLNAGRLRDKPDLLDEVLPSRRFMRIMLWLQENAVTGLIEPKTTWEIVNEACVDLFGASVVESMGREIDARQTVIDGIREGVKGPVGITLGGVDILAHLQQRRRLLDLFSADPMRFIDPVAFWTNLGQNDARPVPECIFVRREGFEDIPDALHRFASPMYQVEVDGRPVFLKIRPESAEHEFLQTQDELLCSTSRFVARGCLSESWIGPELSWISDELSIGTRVRVVPPYNLQKHMLTNRAAHVHAPST